MYSGMSFAGWQLLLHGAEPRHEHCCDAMVVIVPLHADSDAAAIIGVCWLSRTCGHVCVLALMPLLLL